MNRQSIRIRTDGKDAKRVFSPPRAVEWKRRRSKEAEAVNPGLPARVAL
jgi:hypothetical protein